MRTPFFRITALLCVTVPLAFGSAASAAQGAAPGKQGNSKPLPPVRTNPAMAPPSAAPGDTMKSGEANWQSVPELIIAGRAVMRLRSRAGGLTPLERAYSLRQRLGPILTLPNLTAADVIVTQKRSGQTAFIYVRRRLLVTVDRNLAEANESSIEGLAAIWARNLRAALPQVNVTVRMSDDLPAPLTKEAPERTIANPAPKK